MDHRNSQAGRGSNGLFAPKWNLVYPLVLAALVLVLLVACERPQPSTPEGVTPLPATQTGPGVAETVEPSLEVTPFDLLEGDTLHTLFHDGLERTYVLHVPPGFDPSQPAALVIALHGVGLDAAEMMRISHFNDQSDASGFLVVYPEGTGENRSWNGGHCCGVAARDGVDDVGFIRVLIAELSAQMDIDPRRVYATGFSNGAIMTYRLACELSDVIAAFAPVSATQAELDMEVCDPLRPIPLIHFHGTADEPNPYNGGESQAGYMFSSVADQVRFWVGFDGCPAQPLSTTTGSIRHDVYSPCIADVSVELYTINNGMHAWPGGEAVSPRMGEPNMEISATALIWEFFNAHLLP